MKTLTEDYVSYEIAVLLKEKGFNGECIAYYSKYEDNNASLHRWRNKQTYVNVKNNGYTIIPTHQMALKWLREVHKILILIDWNLSEKEYIAYIWDIEKERQQGLHKLRKDGKYLFQYPSYETCIEAAILYALKNLI